MGLFRKQKRSSTEKALAKILAGSEVPHFPQLTVRILQRVRDPEAEIDEITQCLQWDPSLVVRILHTVNTAAYGPANPIRSVSHAVSYMGRAQLEQIVLVLAVRQTLPDKPSPSFEPQRFWRSAARRAALARRIADELHPKGSSECFTAGLLQDMAVPVLAHARPGDYEPILEAWHAGGPRLQELEQDALGWTHAEAGGILGRLWELPPSLTQAIFHHHRTGMTDAQIPPALKLVSQLREGGAHDAEAFVELGRAEYGLQPDWLTEALGRADEQAEELARLMA